MKALFFLLCLVVLHHAQQQQLPHQGVHINFLTMKPHIVMNLERHKQAFEESTGATLNLVSFDYLDLFNQILGDLRDGSPLYDGFVFPPRMMVDFIKCPNCSLEILTKLVRDRPELQWEDISDYFRDYNSVYDGEVYTVPLDGDVHYLYYNMEILESLNRSVPTTWEEYAETAKMAHGLDWNGDGVPDFGSCIPRAPDGESQFFLFGMVASYMQSKGTDQGIYFDVDTLEPLVTTEGFREGLAMYSLLRDVGPPIDDFDVAKAFDYMVEGRCAFSPNWANIGHLSRDTKGLNTSTWDKIGAAIAPGSNRVWDYKKEVWRNCTERPNKCPHAGDDHVNHAPFAANGGWSGAIPVNIPTDRKDAAFDFIVFLANNSDVDVMAGTGFEPYRTSHLDLDLWVSSGFNSKAAEAQIAGLRETQMSNNLVVDLRIQNANEYVSEIVEKQLSLLNTDQITQDEFVANVYTEWQELTDFAGGRRELIQQYRASLGLKPKDFDEEFEVTRAGRIILATVAGVLLLCCLGVFVFLYLNKSKKVWLYASPAFLFATLVGAIISYIGLILMSVYPSTGVCTSALWLYVVGMSLILGNIFAKTFRTWRMFHHARRFTIVLLHNKDIMPITIIITAIAVIILIVWTAMDIPTATRSTTGVDDGEFVTICNSEDYGKEFFLTVVGYFAFLLVIALFLSFNTRDTGAAFNESKVLSLCVYNLTQVLIIVVVCALALDSPDTRYILVVLCLTFGVTVTIFLLFGPKIWRTLQGRGDEIETSCKGSAVTKGKSGGGSSGGTV